VTDLILANTKKELRNIRKRIARALKNPRQAHLSWLTREEARLVRLVNLYIQIMVVKRG
jgi:hypothetical protein